MLGNTHENMVTMQAKWLRLHARMNRSFAGYWLRGEERAKDGLGCTFRMGKVEFRNHLLGIPRFLLPRDPSNSGYSCNPAGFQSPKKKVRQLINVGRLSEGP